MIRDNVRRLLDEIPPGVELVAAAKTRSPAEILEAIQAGVRVIGENYVQEAERARAVIGGRAAWHLIGPLQRNKVKRAVALFDLIETVDSRRLATSIDNACAVVGKSMPVLLEVNSGREPQKAGVFPEEAVSLLRELAQMRHVSVVGLMTMGPAIGDPEEARPYFSRTKALFDTIKDMPLEGVKMQMLSMGMSNSYRVAIQEGATVVRVGTAIFGQRRSDPPR